MPPAEVRVFPPGEVSPLPDSGEKNNEKVQRRGERGPAHQLLLVRLPSVPSHCPSLTHGIGPTPHTRLGPPLGSPSRPTAVPAKPTSPRRSGSPLRPACQRAAPAPGWRGQRRPAAAQSRTGRSAAPEGTGPGVRCFRPAGGRRQAPAEANILSGFHGGPGGNGTN